MAAKVVDTLWPSSSIIQYVLLSRHEISRADEAAKGIGQNLHSHL